MSEIRWGYALSRDSEAWQGECKTRMEAILEGYATYCGDPFWIHSGHVVPLEAVMPDVDAILEQAGEQAYDEAGEVAEEYPDVTNEARIELEGLIRGWFEKHARPTFWVADGECEFIPSPEPVR